MKELNLLKKKESIPSKPSKDILETFANKFPDKDYYITFKTSEFTTLCPITGQPDFATIEIIYIPKKICIESKSLKFYLHSYRNIGEFHEHVTNRILNDFTTKCRPKWAKIIAKFNTRGGINIDVEAEC